MDIKFFIQHLNTPGKLIPAIIKEWQPYFQLKAFKEYDPKYHKINDKTLRPDKMVMKPDPSGTTDDMGNPVLRPSIETLTRIALPLQKLIVERAVAFLTGGTISLTTLSEDSDAQKLFDIIKETWKKNKLQFKNGYIADAVFSQLECAEIWYSEVDEDKNVKLRCKFYSPADGYDLIPVFDNSGDLIAFALQYEDAVSAKERYMDIYTATELRKHKNNGNGWELIDQPVKLPYGKIPVIYYQQPKSAWEDIQTLIDRLERLLSGFGDTNDYNGSPILFAKGEIKGFASKGESGKVIESDGESADLKYVTWEGKPEAVIFEKDTLLDLIYTCTQTPNISFEAMKSLGDISGVAFDRIFVDAHLKARKGHNGWFGEGIQRRLNFLISACAAANPTIKGGGGLEITPVFSLFRIDDVNEKIDTAMKANGNQPVMSHAESISYVGVSTDPAKTYQEIKKQTKATPELKNS